MNKVVTIGDCYEDIFLTPGKATILDHRSFASGKGLCFGYGDKIPLDSITYHIGGSAANTAMNFSRIGISCSVLSSVGGDSQGEKILEYLSDNSIDVSQVKKKSISASNMSVIFSFKGDRTIFTYHGEREPSDYVPNKTQKANWIYLAPLGDDTTLAENRIIELVAKDGTGLIWNPGNFQIDKKARNFRHLLRVCNIVILNKEEIARFVDLPGKSIVEELMKQLHSYGPKMIVVTDGGQGAWCYNGSVFFKIGVTEDKRVDATGAGDAFASSLSAKIILSSSGKGQSYLPPKDVIEQALKWGIIVSGSVVNHVGAHEGILSIDQIEEREIKLVKLNPEIYTK